MWKWLKVFARKWKACAEEAHRLRNQYVGSKEWLWDQINNDWEVW